MDEGRTYVEIGERASRVDRARNHLHQLVRRDTVAHPRVQERREGRDETPKEERDDVRPPRKRSLALEDHDQA